MSSFCHSRRFIGLILLISWRCPLHLTCKGGVGGSSAVSVEWHPLSPRGDPAGRRCVGSGGLRCRSAGGADRWQRPDAAIVAHRPRRLSYREARRRRDPPSFQIAARLMAGKIDGHSVSHGHRTAGRICPRAVRDTAHHSMGPVRDEWRAAIWTNWPIRLFCA